MSVITLQVGQCGNQVGGQLFTGLMEDTCSKLSQVNVSASKNKDYIEEVLERFFVTEDRKVPEARAVMVDMESKAIAQTCAEARKTGLWKYPDKQQFCQKRGSGNNWANGFKIHGPAAETKILEMVQREAEKCDNLAGFMVFLSLAGGTGSGVGTSMTQCVKEEFPNAFLLNQVVWPYNTGEVIVQNYNAVLTLSHLYQSSDAILVMENDQLHKICTRLLNLKKVGFKDINKVICHKLSGILQPAYREKHRGYQSSNSLASTHPLHIVIWLSVHSGEMLEHLVPVPDYKLLTAKNIPQMSDTAKDFSTFQWHGLLKHLRQMLIASAAMEEGLYAFSTVENIPQMYIPQSYMAKESGTYHQLGLLTHYQTMTLSEGIDWQVKLDDSRRSLANLLLLRGKDLDGVDFSAFSDPRLYPNWIPTDSKLTVYTQPRLFNDYEKCATLITNNKAPISSLNHVIDKAWNMFSSRAYIHQYVKYGISEEDFIDSFVTLEQVISNYSKL